MGLSRDVSWLPLFSASYFLWRCFESFSGSDIGIDIRYCTDGSVFNLRNLQTKTKVKTDIVNEFLFADDFAQNATNKANMQNDVDKFSVACDNFGLTISTKKRQVMHQPPPGKLYVEPNITIKGQQLKVVEKFTYLSSILSKYIVMDDKVNTRLASKYSLWPTQQECVESERHLRGNKNLGIPNCHSYHLSFMAVKRWLLINGI